MTAIDWQDITLRNFSSMLVEQDDGTRKHVMDPYGDGVAQRIMTRLEISIEAATGRALKPWLIEPVERLDSYTEITPIHRGLKRVHV